MTAITEAPAEPELIPLEQLSRRLERAVRKHGHPDHREHLLARIKAGPEHPADRKASGLTRLDTVVFCRQVLMAVPRDGRCARDREAAAECEPRCPACLTADADRSTLAGLIAAELDEMEAQLTAEMTGTACEDPEPSGGAWWAHCSHCGTRYQCSRSQTRFCGATCRKAAQRARQKAAGQPVPG